MIHLVVYYYSGVKKTKQCILFILFECHIQKTFTRAVSQHSTVLGNKQDFIAAHPCDGLLHLKEVLQCLSGLLKGC